MESCKEASQQPGALELLAVDVIDTDAREVESVYECQKLVDGQLTHVLVVNALLGRVRPVLPQINVKPASKSV